MIPLILPSVETLVWIWVVTWITVALIAGVLVVMAHRLVQSLVDERREAYHVQARGTRLRRVMIFILSMLMLFVGGWQLVIRTRGWSREVFGLDVGEITPLLLSAIGPLLVVVLLSELRDERILLGKDDTRTLWNIAWRRWRWWGKA